MFDLKMSYELAKSIVKEKGWEGWMEHLQSQFPEKRLYGSSQDWYDSAKYICKATGSFGDVLVGWIHHF